MKFLQISISLSLLITIFVLSSCVNCVEPEGEIKTRNLKLDNFTKIDIEIPSVVTIITGDSAKITISAPESILAQILPIVRRNRLNLEGNICNIDNDQINIEITVPIVSSIKIKGSAKVFSEIPIKTDKLTLTIKGSGGFSLNVFANSIITNISGSGDIIINGTTKKT